jgi:hypothetical protein
MCRFSDAGTTQVPGRVGHELAGVRELELRYPGTSHVSEMSVITVVGSAETRQQRPFGI